MGNVRTKKFLSTENLLWCAAAAMLPVVVLTYFFNRNAAHLAVWTMPIVFAMVGLISLFGWVAAYFIFFRSPFSAFVACLTAWVVCFSYPWIYAHVFPVIGVTVNRLLTGGAIAAIAAIAMALLAQKLVYSSKFAPMVCVFLVCIFAMNAIPLAAKATKARAANAQQNFGVKTNFIVETDTQAPDVYWIHCDGMLGFDAFEKYYGDAQAEFLAQLAQRGFAVNRSAMFEAGRYTNIAVPALMSPDAYDSCLFPKYLYSHEAAMKISMIRDSVKEVVDARLHNEMIAAFEAKQYETNLITLSEGQFIFPTTDSVYFSDMNDNIVLHPQDGGEDISQRYDILDMAFFLHQTSALTVPFTWMMDVLYPAHGPLAVNGAESIIGIGEVEPYNLRLSQEELQSVLGEAWDEPSRLPNFVNAFADILYKEKNAPNLSILFNDATHYYYVRREDGSMTENARSFDPLHYKPQHIHAAKVLIAMIDMILAENPDAVIVLQADHGLHGTEEKEFIEAFGPDANALELWNSVMSAIRVPQKYQNGDEHYAVENPLNISRYLVNSFVGKNYEYLP